MSRIRATGMSLTSLITGLRTTGLVRRAVRKAGRTRTTPHVKAIVDAIVMAAVGDLKRIRPWP